MTMGKKRYGGRPSGGRSGGGGRGGRPEGGNRGGPRPGSRRRRRRSGDGGFRRDGAPENEAIENGEVRLEEGCGLLELHPNGYGFLRSPDNNYSRERSDPFVPGTMIEKFGLRQGLMITGLVQPAGSGVAVVEHHGCRLLRRGARGGIGTLRPTGDL